MSKSKSKSKNSKSKSKSTLIDALNKRRRPQNQSRKLPENVIVEAIERYAAGESFAAIAADYLVSSATIRYHVNKVRG